MWVAFCRQQKKIPRSQCSISKLSYQECNDHVFSSQHDERWKWPAKHCTEIIRTVLRWCRICAKTCRGFWVWFLLSIFCCPLYLPRTPDQYLPFGGISHTNPITGILYELSCTEADTYALPFALPCTNWGTGFSWKWIPHLDHLGLYPSPRWSLVPAGLRLRNHPHIRIWGLSLMEKVFHHFIAV